MPGDRPAGGRLDRVPGGRPRPDRSADPGHAGGPDGQAGPGGGGPDGPNGPDGGPDGRDGPDGGPDGRDGRGGGGPDGRDGRGGGGPDGQAGPGGGGRGRAFTARTPRIVAARRLQRRRDRDQTGRFLAEGPQAVRSALAAGVVVELFGTGTALARYADLAAQAPVVSPVTDDGLAALAETVQPQGLVAVCEQLDVSLAEAVAKQPRLVAVAAEIRDPGNAGTVLRTADAAGAGAVVFAGDAVDPYNGKCVRASAGSLFHVDVVRAPLYLVDDLRDAGLQVLATTGHGDVDLDELLDDGSLARPTAWLFGSEAHGLPDELLAAADRRVRVPIYGGAESLNLAAAAAVCLYTSARAHR